MLDYLEITEQEFTLERDGKPFLKGTPDSVRVYESRRIVAVCERKFGRKVVQAADANLQLRCYLVLVAEQYPAHRYFACLTQPRVSSKPQMVFYGPSEIDQARQEIFDTYDACFAPDAQRRTSREGCEFCTAHAVCPEYIAWISAVRKAEHLPTAQWSDAQMEDFLTVRPLVEKFCRERLEDIKLIKAANPERLPGWSLKPGANVRTVSDLVQAWSALQTYMTAKEFSGECDVSVTGLERLLYEKFRDNPSLGKKSQREVKALLNKLLDGILALRQNKPSLVKDE